MPEAFVPHIVLHLSEDRLGFYGTARPVHQALLRGQPLSRPALVLHEFVVDLHFSFPVLSFVASAPERTSVTSLSPVDGDFRAVAASRTSGLCPHPGHVLAHRADKVVVRGIVVQVLRAENVLLERTLLLLVEVVVLDVLWAPEQTVQHRLT